MVKHDFNIIALALGTQEQRREIEIKKIKKNKKYNVEILDKC